MRKVKGAYEPPQEAAESPVAPENAEPVYAEADPENDAQNEDGGLFGPESMEAVRGLLFLGRIETEFEFGGHRFLIRTLTQGERIEALQLASKYKGTGAEGEALKACIVGAAVQAVDGEPLYRPVKMGEDATYQKYLRVRQWYPGVVRAVYRAVNALEKTADDAVAALKK